MGLAGPYHLAPALPIAIYIRLSLQEPIFQESRRRGRLEQSLARGVPEQQHPKCADRQRVVLGQGCVWYTASSGRCIPPAGQELDVLTLQLQSSARVADPTPTLVFWGWLSDKIGRKPIILAACCWHLTYYPLYMASATTPNPNNATTQVGPHRAILSNYVG